ncbi:MAG: MBG domain-containing protein, partial [Verrucomicrobiota bacterium]
QALGTWGSSSSGATHQDNTHFAGNGTLTVGVATPVVTVTVGTYTYNGSAQGPNTFTTSPAGDSGTATWSYAGTGTTNYGPSATRPTNAGSYTATATVAADSNYSSASSSATAFSIGKATPSATLAVSNTPTTYNGSTHAATVGITASSTPGTAQNVLTGGSDSQTAVGTYSVIADFVPNDTTNYNTLTAQAAGSFSIDKASQTIDFSLASSVAKSAGSLALAGTASSGLSVSYVSSVPAIASVSGNTLTLHQGGTLTLTASQAGDDHYTAATSVVRNLVITGFAAMNDAVSRPANSSGIKIPVATLLANDGEMDSEARVVPGTGLTISGVTAGSGNSVRVSGAYVFFTPSDPAASAPTTFTYTVSDGTSAATATVTVSTIDATPFTLDLLRVVSAPVFANGSTSVTVEFAGVPNQTYQIEYSATMAENSWSSPQAVNSGDTGPFIATFTKDGDQTAAWSTLFFRATR